MLRALIENKFSSEGCCVDLSLQGRSGEPMDARPRDPGLARPSIDHEHRGLHCSGAQQVQGLLAIGGEHRLEGKKADTAQRLFLRCVIFSTATGVIIRG
jgi:hypothetical protein